MILGMAIFLTIVCFGVLTHDKTRFESKVYKNIPLYDWMLITFFPVGCFVATAIFVRSIVLRQFYQVLPFQDFEILIVGTLVLIYASAGNSIHFTSKVLWRYLDPHKQKTAYEVNELFHGKFSHLLSFVGVLLIMFSMSLLEINHPLPLPIDQVRQWVVLLAGIFTGGFVTKMIINSRSDSNAKDFSWSVNRSVFLIGLTIGLLHIYIIYIYKLNLLLYPFNTYTVIFIISVILAFLVRKAYFLFVSKII